MALSSGDILLGKYRIEEEIGAGGMGVVLRATHLDLREAFAVKVLRSGFANEPLNVERFLREARAAAKVKSPHAVRVFDVGHLPDGEPYMVMELLSGEDLRERLRRGPLAPEDAVCHIVEACDAISEAHALGIVHRDIKPANLFVARDSRGRALTKVLDFGISKAFHGSADVEPHITRTGARIGTARYMAPEQLLGLRDTGPSVDIWALGITFFELLTGACPFEGATRDELAAQILRDPPRRCRDLRPDIDPGIEAVALRCIEKPPRDRFHSVADLARALAEYAPVRASGVLSRFTVAEEDSKEYGMSSLREKEVARAHTRTDSEAAQATHETIEVVVEESDHDATFEGTATLESTEQTTTPEGAERAATLGGAKQATTPEGAEQPATLESTKQAITSESGEQHLTRSVTKAPPARPAFPSLRWLPALGLLLLAMGVLAVRTFGVGDRPDIPPATTLAVSVAETPSSTPPETATTEPPSDTTTAPTSESTALTAAATAATDRIQPPTAPSSSARKNVFGAKKPCPSKFGVGCKPLAPPIGVAQFPVPASASSSRPCRSKLDTRCYPPLGGFPSSTNHFKFPAPTSAPAGSASSGALRPWDTYGPRK